MSGPEYEHEEVRTMSGQTVRVYTQCLHGRPEPVHAAVTGEVVAWLCPDCDMQLPATWKTQEDWA